MTLTAESVDGVDGCNRVLRIRSTSSTRTARSISLQLSLSVCQNLASVAVSPYDAQSGSPAVTEPVPPPGTCCPWCDRCARAEIDLCIAATERQATPIYWLPELRRYADLV